MPIKGTKSLGASKITTLVTAYTTELAIAPAAGHVSVYIDLADADAHREVEVKERLQNLIDYARERDWGRRINNTTRYYYMFLYGSKTSIVTATDRTDIEEGMVAIGINTAVLSGNRGSIILNTCFKEIMDWMREKGNVIQKEAVLFDGDDTVTLDGEGVVY